MKMVTIAQIFTKTKGVNPLVFYRVWTQSQYGMLHKFFHSFCVFLPIANFPKSDILVFSKEVNKNEYDGKIFNSRACNFNTRQKNSNGLCKLLQVLS